MQVWLRLLVVWFVAIGLPVQGLAGVTMAHCGQSHARMGAAMQASQHGHAAHDAGAAHRHDADTAVNADLADPIPVTQAKAQAGNPSDLGQYKCSSCASCCSAAVIGSTVLTVPATGVPPTVFIAVVAAVERFFSDGPDRPPRVLLA